MDGGLRHLIGHGVRYRVRSDREAATLLQWIARSWLGVTFTLLLAASPADARSGGGHGGGHGHGGHGHFHGHGRVFVGGGAWWWGPDPWWWYYPPPYYAYWPTVAVDQPSVYIERQPIAPPTEQFWYFCQPAGAYYPNARTCAEPWIKITPRAQ